jgi:hypothetical protein
VPRAEKECEPWRARLGLGARKVVPRRPVSDCLEAVQLVPRSSKTTEVEELKRKVADLERGAKSQQRPGGSLRSRGWFKEVMSEKLGIRKDSGAS